MKKILLLLVVITTIQANAQCWTSVATGYTHTLALKSDGTLWAWGQNDEGQLGIGSFTDKDLPKQVGTDNNWQWVGAGKNYSVALKNNGTLWSWGTNSNGQLGNGTLITSLNPVQIGTDTNWAFVSTGVYHNLAVKTNGTLWAWGANTNHQLGDNTIVQKSTPVQIGTDTNWASTAAGTFHSAAIKTDGSLWTWGNNAWGQLGTSSYAFYDFAFPVKVSVDANWHYLSLGQETTLALKTDGSFWGCGDGMSASIISIESQSLWSSVAGSGGNNYAIKQDGTLWALGYNSYGEIGNGSQTASNTYTPVNNDTDWAYVTSKLSTVAAIKNDGTLWMWGKNDYGQLANQTTNAYALNPVQVSCTLIAGVAQNHLQNLSIYPNPAKDVITINNPAGISIENILVYDVTGKLVQQQTTALTINVQHLPQGVYLLKVIATQGTQTYKFIKQ